MVDVPSVEVEEADVLADLYYPWPVSDSKLLVCSGKAPASALLALTKDNVRSQLPAVLDRFLTCTMGDLADYRQIVAQLYEPDAVFDFPTLRVRGRTNLVRFWTLFLFVRLLLGMDPHTFRRMEVTFDPVTMRLFLDMEVLIRSKYLAWLEALLGRPITPLKIWSPHAIQLREDAAGKLRIWHQEELANQAILFGMFVMHAFVSLRVDPHTPLGFVVETAREVVGWVVCMAVAVLEGVLTALRVQL